MQFLSGIIHAIFRRQQVADKGDLRGTNWQGRFLQGVVRPKAVQ